MKDEATDEAVAFEMATRSPYSQEDCLHLVRKHGHSIAGLGIELGCRGVPINLAEKMVDAFRSVEGGAS